MQFIIKFTEVSEGIYASIFMLEEEPNVAASNHQAKLEEFLSDYLGSRARR
jgi:hypothetical protein